MNNEAISEATPLIDLGVDSLVAVEIRTWFANEIGIDVAVLKILGGPSIYELVDDTVSKLTPSLFGESSDAATHNDGNGGTASSVDSSTENTNSKVSSRTSVTDPEDLDKRDETLEHDRNVVLQLLSWKVDHK
jgi:acyl carrier protein